MGAPQVDRGHVEPDLHSFKTQGKVWLWPPKVTLLDGEALTVIVVDFLKKDNGRQPDLCLYLILVVPGVFPSKLRRSFKLENSFEHEMPGGRQIRHPLHPSLLGNT